MPITQVSEREARMRFVYAYAKLTVWIWQNNSGQWEIIDWYGNVLGFSKYRADIENIAYQLASDTNRNIHAVATIVDPQKRRPNKRRATRRVP